MYHLSSVFPHRTLTTLLIVALCRTSVANEPSKCPVGHQESSCRLKVRAFEPSGTRLNLHLSGSCIYVVIFIPIEAIDWTRSPFLALCNGLSSDWFTTFVVIAQM